MVLTRAVSSKQFLESAVPFWLDPLQEFTDQEGTIDKSGVQESGAQLTQDQEDAESRCEICVRPSQSLQRGQTEGRRSSSRLSLSF